MQQLLPKKYETLDQSELVEVVRYIFPLNEVSSLSFCGYRKLIGRVLPLKKGKHTTPNLQKQIRNFYCMEKFTSHWTNTS